MTSNRLGRRTLLSMLTGATAAWPCAVRSEATRKIGVLLFSTPEADGSLPALRRTLVDLGYVEGRNVVFEFRYAEGKIERLPDLAKELVRTQPDVLFALGGEVTAAAVAATRTIPLVFTSSQDPVQLGFVASLARPGGNATGVTFLLDDLAAKRLEILKEAVPAVSRVAFLWNPDHIDNELREAERAAAPLGVHLERLPMKSGGEIESALRGAAEARAQALYVVSSRLTLLHLRRFVAFADQIKVPLIGGFGAWARRGALLSYGPNIDEMVGRAATYVDKILKGTKPADLPVQQPTRFELAINLKTAKSLGLAIAPTLIVRADEVIE